VRSQSQAPIRRPTAARRTLKTRLASLIPINRLWIRRWKVRVLSSAANPVNLFRALERLRPRHLVSAPVGHEGFVGRSAAFSVRAVVDAWLAERE
jgi:hypothetical protein